MAKIKFGEIEGVSEGDIFNSRAELTATGVHRNIQAGIDGNGREGCASIVLSGGYSDDRDYGDLIIYTGHGGQGPNGVKQVKDQSPDSFGNKGLQISEVHGLPVRVTRGANHKSDYSPGKGYKYGGLYQVTESSWKKEEGRFGVCIFKLEKISSLASSNGIKADSFDVNAPAPRIPTTLLRIVRDTSKSREIKELYNYTCQVCSLRIELNGIGYAEGAHIKPLGRPHNGSDDISNLLCLCPNHHVMFDKFHFTVDHNFSLVGLQGNLHVKHNINMENFKYHYSLCKISNEVK